LKSSKSQLRDYFVNKLGAQEKGIFERAGSFVPYEHVVYAERGLSAITITASDTTYLNKYHKFSILDRDFQLSGL
jgi:hypothetical protein